MPAAYDPSTLEAVRDVLLELGVLPGRWFRQGVWHQAVMIALGVGSNPTLRAVTRLAEAHGYIDMRPTVSRENAIRLNLPERANPAPDPAAPAPLRAEVLAATAP